MRFFQQMPTLMPGAGRASRAAALIGMLAFAVALSPAIAAPPESKLKAALVYKISAYVSWPEETQHGAEPLSFNVCGLGKSAMDGALDSLSGRMTKGRAIQYREVALEQLADADCHLLFVPPDQELGIALNQLAGRAILTIGEDQDFALSGGMIELHRKQNRFGFRINRRAASRAGLIIAAPLLELATLVEETASLAQEPDS